MNKIPTWVLAYLDENTDNEADYAELYDYAHHLIVDKGCVGETLNWLLDEYVEGILS